MTTPSHEQAEVSSCGPLMETAAPLAATAASLLLAIAAATPVACKHGARVGQEGQEGRVWGGALRRGVTG